MSLRRSVSHHSIKMDIDVFAYNNRMRSLGLPLLDVDEDDFDEEQFETGDSYPYHLTLKSKKRVAGEEIVVPKKAKTDL